VMLSMIASVTNQGKARWMIIDGAFNHERLIEFFEALIKDTDRKVFLILDNLGVHHCKPMKAWLEDHLGQMEVFYLPSYSPELNPEERLNADLKHDIVVARCRDAHESQTSRCRGGSHGGRGLRTRACQSLLPRPQGQICRMNLFIAHRGIC